MWLWGPFENIFVPPVQLVCHLGREVARVCQCVPKDVKLSALAIVPWVSHVHVLRSSDKLLANLVNHCIKMEGGCHC